MRWMGPVSLPCEGKSLTISTPLILPVNKRRHRLGVSLVFHWEAYRPVAKRVSLDELVRVLGPRMMNDCCTDV